MVFVCVCIVFLERTVVFFQNMFKPFPPKKKKSAKKGPRNSAVEWRYPIARSKLFYSEFQGKTFFSESISFSRSTLPETNSSPLKIGRAPKVMLVSGMVTLRDLNKWIHSRFCWLWLFTSLDMSSKHISREFSCLLFFRFPWETVSFNVVYKALTIQFIE